MKGVTKIMTRYELPVMYDNLTTKERREVREQYVKEQKGLCYWCKADLSAAPRQDITEKRINLKLFPPGFLNFPIHLQHDHQEGLTEGAVHARCNAVMWQHHGR
jgi:hypothetical protein